ncbi:MAG: hypothetical protein GW779_02720 [Candidatus Altiarchaeum hamiconexum]|uniref:RING-type E3 ubiquitin transferase n=1 Tax=Candidatus Altarchaeum hamiconexum TaxID=1803513 RepID=A0A8J7YYL3_9ARCH|nr:hypothetical protein [Candidatus Altarchaeum hamiconexum]PIN68001.1 MAG: hypothetical protein COV98_00825 [Candidatus Altarchaeum sp. CG12_big_fil_rev_8_21_14_0_65_33_22]PIV27813.1 MAG: hypothetical protein COS36_04540 [Candidatus Altarchaeum sp. CG03_land_8_20_14_0_80_32_618]PIX49077.1 MAG: hypothetical protein COZ53_01790 [Candidatus Altarchaeum sp. CG_4_8_14_3_um_filter_33_2054]PIZ30164.1 MAG: hypothetical protein COY41_04565 [Candidatus Altarchaeum sp. CG_4_10_14_0_8_um_filter_32_851]PJ
MRVLGEASDTSGELKIAKPVAKSGNFIISTKSKEELTEEIRKKIQYLKSEL